MTLDECMDKYGAAYARLDEKLRFVVTGPSTSVYPNGVGHTHGYFLKIINTFTDDQSLCYPGIADLQDVEQSLHEWYDFNSLDWHDTDAERRTFNTLLADVEIDL